jgi:transaldolase
MMFEKLRVKVFCDAGLPGSVARHAADPRIQGFTTNPTLMRASGVTDYRAFAEETLALVGQKPISFEVLEDTLEGIERQARIIASWGDNVYVKVPVTNTQRVSCADVVRRLSRDGVKVNVTAVFTHEQVAQMLSALEGGAPSVVSIFAGRIADAGIDPVPHMKRARSMCRAAGEQIELLWASPREVFNVVQADDAGCDIITLTDGLLAKLPSLGKDLTEFSQETVQMFRNDAVAAKYDL